MSISGLDTGSLRELATRRNPHAVRVTLSRHAETRPGAGESRARGLVAFAFAMGGVVRDAVYVTADALRGRYDSF